MDIVQRRYGLLADFPRVHEFLTEIYSLETLNSYLLPQFFEYAHTHPAFNHKLTHRFGLWEEGGEIVGIACYEMDLGQAFLVTDADHAELLPGLLTWAEKELSLKRGGQRILEVWITDREAEKTALLQSRGYTRVHAEPVRIFRYQNPFPEAELPPGFSLFSLEEENDPRRINECLWKGFDHGDSPEDDPDSQLLMQSGPNFRPDLTTVIKAPNGDYACYAGMWFDEKNKYAYLEPLATVPEYRRMGLATAALAECMGKTKALGAEYCFGGVPKFYASLGFETICHRELWRKEW